jgi:hypothetical protein
LRKGARLQCEGGVIDRPTEAEINELIDIAPLRDFKPVLCIIPFSAKIKKMAHPVQLAARANPLHVEYVITDLQGGMFDRIELMPI